jgi:hypothetical protein
MAKKPTPRTQKPTKRPPPPPQQQGPPPRGGNDRRGNGDGFGCDKEFLAVGRGEAKNKIAALQAAHDDAKDTASAECLAANEGCPRAVLIARGKVDVQRDPAADAKERFKATVEDKYKCVSVG